ncbi:uncharacterized protein RJT21DRAFT_118273 [Scheffersomyces amazonensis]|uniref:uncharacterized protein n=1 Tax=Scheffersomyces amazonensis TaxID=1078765 RepID=UPI00315DD9ED
MFKKDPQPKASANIKSSERRKLLATICDEYSLSQDKIPKDDLNKILPLTTKQASFKSLQGFSGTLYYDENETPTWFKTRDSRMYPSLFTVWKCPYIVPVIMTHPHVIEILEGGADLMLPGTIPPFDKRCARGAVVGVVDSANPTVVKAIGRCNIDMWKYDRVIGTQGVAVEVLHVFKDELYKKNELVDIAVPKELDLSSPVEEEVPAETEVESTEPVEEMSERTPEVSVASSSTIDDIAEAVSTLTVEEVDHFYIRSLQQTIKLETIELPIIASTFMSSYIYKNLPVIDNSYCNVKKTSWKKTSKFLKAMVKEKLLEVKGKDDDLSIVKLMDKSNPFIENFVPHKTIGSLSKPSAGPTPSKKDGESRIIHLYKPTNKSRMFFNKIDKRHDNYFTANELRTFITNYTKSAKLTNPKNPKEILVDDILSGIVASPISTSMARDQLFKKFLATFSPHYQIVMPGQDEFDAEVYKGEPPKINIITEMRIGRKVVTRVLNFENFGIKPHILSDELKVKCSGSSTVGPCVQNPKLTEVTVQGPHAKIIIELLKEKGVPISSIEFEDKQKKKKKKTT